MLVNSRENALFIYEIASGRQIATDEIRMEKGQIVKNNNHYRDYQKKIADHESDIYGILGDETGGRICSIIKQTVPKIYKDQLVGRRPFLADSKISGTYTGDLRLTDRAPPRSSLSSRTTWMDISCRSIRTMRWHELSSRDEKRILQNMKRATFPLLKHLEEFDYRFQTTVTKKQISRLLDFTFIDNRENIIFICTPCVARPIWPLE